MFVRLLARSLGDSITHLLALSFARSLARFLTRSLAHSLDHLIVLTLFLWFMKAPMLVLQYSVLRYSTVHFDTVYFDIVQSCNYSVIALSVPEAHFPNMSGSDPVAPPTI